MSKITQLMIICFLALFAVPVVSIVVPVTSNSAFAVFDCPSCHAWRCDVGDQQKVCFIACLEDYGYYHFYAEIYKWDEEFLRYVYDWQYVLCVVNGTNCEEPCHEYTAVMDLTSGWDGFSGKWMLRNMEAYLLVCDGDEFQPEP